MFTFKNILKLFIALPFILGFIGYFHFGEGDFWESIYAAIALYFVNPVSDTQNNFILVAKLLSILVITSVFLSLFESLLSKMVNAYKRSFKDSTVIYTDQKIINNLLIKSKHTYISSKYKTEKTNSHIIMFENDIDNLNFYYLNRELLKKSKVYILLQEVDTSLLRIFNDNNVHFFNTNEIISRNYWKENNLFHNRHEENLKIAIVNYNEAGESLFKFGYLNNIYELDQKIEYHIWGENEHQKSFLQKLDFVNSDKVVLHDGLFSNSLEIFNSMTRIILTNEDTLVSDVQLLLSNNIKTPIHYLNSQGLNLNTFFNNDNLKGFGSIKEVLTEENIKDEGYYRLGKLFNYDYTLRCKNRKVSNDFEKEMEKEWEDLDGFKKGSSIARGDHYWVEMLLKNENPNISKDELYRIEHIRWCRYHLINKWKYGETRNDDDKVHNLLIPYDKLPVSEKIKDGIFSERLLGEIENLSLFR